MKILSGDQVKAVDEALTSQGKISSLSLMEKAAIAFVNWYVKNYGRDIPVTVFCGPGNNGGDGLAIARLLHQHGYALNVFILKEEKCSKDFTENLGLLRNLIEVKALGSKEIFPSIQSNANILDCLFGVGLNRPLEGLTAELVDFINKSGEKIISVDIASGLYADAITGNTVVIRPYQTITFQAPKLSFMFAENYPFVGDLVVLDIGIPQDLINQQTSSYHYIDAAFVKPLLKKRHRFDHKGIYGKALIIGGHYGMIGAVVLATKACYRSGTGTVRAYVPSCGYTVLQTTVPEAMTLTDSSYTSITDIPDTTTYNAIAIGPGMNEDEDSYRALKKLLSIAKLPLILDAGALNMMGAHRELLELIPANSILTPHPKEFERLTQPYTDSFSKISALKTFSKQRNCIVILKGSNTAVALPDGNVYFNSTGNPGMATGGSGDVLAGIITGLLAQTYTPSDAAIVGVFLHGYAGDAAATRRSQPSMLAGDIIEGIDNFYKEMQQI